MATSAEHDAGAVERLHLLSDVSAHLLLTDDTRDLVRGVFEKLAPHLGLDVCLHYLAEEGTRRPVLHFRAGVPPEVASEIEHPEFGEAVCGYVAREPRRFVAEEGPGPSDPHPELLRRLGVRAFACHPLLARGELVGTLGFGSRARAAFSPDELGLMEAVSARVAAATGRLRQVAALRQRASELAEAARRKDDFLALLAHELRDPLAPIRTALHVLRLRGPDDPALRSPREVIERQVAHLGRLVDDLLDVSRIARGKVKLLREAVDLAAVANRAVETVRPLVEERRHTLTVSLCPEPLRLHGDPTRLTQVLANLLHNAAKYTDDGGHVWLTLARDVDEAVVRVEDTGTGIPPEMLPRVFDPFTQADRSLERTRGGLGIGLTLVRSLVQMHGGTVEAHSEGPGRGSEFVVRLPLPRADRADRDERGAAPDARSAGGKARRVLVVDDNRDAAESLAALLRLWGHDVRVAHDGPGALEAAWAYRPEVVLLDIGVPGLSGLDVARRLRADPTFDGAVLVATTGYGQEEDRRRSREAGFDHHLVKPLDLAALEALLGSPRAGKPARAAVT